MNYADPPTLAYLVSQYPAVSHTFILREVLRLRELGLEIRTASVKGPGSSPDGLTPAEADEVARTFYVMARPVPKILWDHASCLVRRPLGYTAGLWLALRLGRLDLKALLYHLLYFGEAVVIGEWMRRNALSHLHVHFANAASTAALLIGKTHRIPFSMTVHGPDEFYDTELYRLREKIEGASFICTISRFCRSQLMKLSHLEHWEKMDVCALGVNPEVFAPRPATGNKVFRIVCVGRLCPAKGQGILLAAVTKLAERDRDVHLDLVGDGPDRKALESAVVRLNIAPRVTFHGAVNQLRVHEFLSRADVFVLPSFAEGVPVSLMEAMAMEVPCVSTRIAGIPELIESGEDGVLAPASDAERLADAIERLIVDPEWRLRLGQAGRRKVLEHYNLRTNTDRLAAIFERRLGVTRRTAETVV